MQQILEHLKWSELLTIEAEDNLFSVCGFAAEASPLLVSFEYVHKLD